RGCARPRARLELAARREIAGRDGGGRLRGQRAGERGADPTRLRDRSPPTLGLRAGNATQGRDPHLAALLQLRRGVRRDPRGDREDPRSLAATLRSWPSFRLSVP